MKARSVVVLLFVLILSTASAPVFAQTTPTPPTELFPGDIAIVGFDFDPTDEFTIVVLKDIPTPTQVSFTDKGWASNTNGFVTRDGDTEFDYWIPAGTKAGTVISFLSSSTTGEFTLNDQGDQLFVYTKSDSQPLRVIFGLNSSGTGWQEDCSNNQTSALPPGLDMNTSIAFNHIDNGFFIARNFESPTEALKAIVNLDYTISWKIENTRLTLPADPFIFTTTNVDLEKIIASQKSFLSNPIIMIFTIFGLILSLKVWALRSKIK